MNRVFETLSSQRWPLVAGLGMTQVVGWGSMFYAYAILMQPMQRDLGVSTPVVVGAYSMALLMSGALSTFAGKIVDRIGGRLLMSGGTVMAGAMLMLLARVETVWQLYLVWLGVGVAMSAALYTPAFTVLTQAFGANYRSAITMLTLIAGFSSTVSWPLTQYLLDETGWRAAWQVFAFANIVLCLPVHALLPAWKPLEHNSNGQSGAPPVTLAMVLRDPVFQAMTGAFTLNALAFSGVSLHLMAILQSHGLPAATAALIGAVVGPMQVGGRIAEMTFGRRFTVLQVGMAAIWALPASLLLLLSPRELTPHIALYVLFATIYGMSNGVMTIVRGTLPVELYGLQSYGAISGAMTTPVTCAIAAGPFVAALIHTASGGTSGSYAGTIAALTLIGAGSGGLFVLTRLFLLRRRA